MLLQITILCPLNKYYWEREKKNQIVFQLGKKTSLIKSPVYWIPFIILVLEISELVIISGPFYLFK